MKTKKKSNVRSYTDTTRVKTKVRYSDEQHFNKLLKSLKLYNMGAYKELMFFYIPQLREHKLIGEPLKDNRYKCTLTSSDLFNKVHGEPYMEYIVNDDTITIDKLEPENFLIAGHIKVLQVYKGVPILDARDRFRVDLAVATKNIK